MALVALGVDHRSTPLEERERFVYAPAELNGALARLRAAAQLDECVLLSTCNRTELYGICRQLGGAFERLAAFLAADRAVEPQVLEAHAFRLHDDAAVAHLLRVAAGLESMVLGEGQVLGQVRSGFSAARRAATLGPELDALGRYALACGKRARNESAIARSPASFPQAALTLARQHVRSLPDARVLVVGAGTMAASTVTWFKRAGAGDIAVASRTQKHADALAQRRQVRAVPLESVAETVAASDIIVVSTSAMEPVLHAAMFLPGGTSTRCVIDLGVPRGVDAAVAHVPGVRLFDLDDLQQLVAAGHAARTAEIAAVEAIVEEEAARYLVWQRARHVAPTIAQLQAHAEAVRSGETQRLRRELGALSPAQEEAIARFSRSLVNKMLHRPVTRLKEYAQDRHGSAYVDAIRNLFGLDSPELAEPVTFEKPAEARARRR